MPRMPAAVSLTWAQMSECQLRRWHDCIHAIYIWTRVEPPHCRALSMMRRMGRPARRSASMTAATRRWGRLSLKATSVPRVLCLTLTQVTHQYSKSWRQRRVFHCSGPVATAYCRSSVISRGTKARGRPSTGVATSMRSPEHPMPLTGSKSVSNARRRREFS